MSPSVCVHMGPSLMRRWVSNFAALRKSYSIIQALNDHFIRIVNGQKRKSKTKFQKLRSEKEHFSKSKNPRHTETHNTSSIQYIYSQAYFGKLRSIQEESLIGSLRHGTVLNASKSPSYWMIIPVLLSVHWRKNIYRNTGPGPGTEIFWGQSNRWSRVKSIKIKEVLRRVNWWQQKTPVFSMKNDRSWRNQENIRWLGLKFPVPYSDLNVFPQILIGL